MKFIFFLFKHTNNINCFGIFSFLEYSKLKIGIFYSAEYFFAFSHSFKYQKFFAAKTLTQMSHLFFIAGLGPIVFFYRWITWPGVFLGCFLVLTWCCFLLTDWILLFSWFFRISHLSHDWRPSSCLLCLSTTGFCSIILQRRFRSVHFLAPYSPMTLLLLFFFFLFGQSCLLLFSSFFFISLVYYLKCPAVTLFILLHCSGL